MASLLALLLAGTAACGNVDDSTPQPDDSTTSTSAMDGSSCRVINRTVNIDEQSDLTRFSSLDCFRIEGHLFVQNSTNIRNLDALSGLRSVSGYIGIADNTRLRRVTLPNLKRTGEGLVFEGNQRLEKISLPKLEEVGGYLHIFNNQRLVEVDLPCLEKVGGDVIFAGDDALTKLKLPCLKYIGGKFIFEHSEPLKYLCLPQLRRVKGSFLVHFNRDLRAILAPHLKYIGGKLEIQRNPNLVKVDLRNLDKVKRNVEILFNHKWSTCKIRKLVQGIDYIGGRTIIRRNYSVCRSVRIHPPYWCSTKACKKSCDGKDCPPPGDDDDDDDDMTCKERCKKYAKKQCKGLHGYKYKQCVRKKYRKCVKRRCKPGDDDDDDDDDMTCKERCKKYAKKQCKGLHGHKYKQCVREKYRKCVKRRCKPGDDDDDDDDDDDMTCKERCKKYAKKQCKRYEGHAYSWCFIKKFKECYKRYCKPGDDDDDDDGYQACTPGYWKNHLNSWTCEGLWPNKKLKRVFNYVPSQLQHDTLIEALRYHGGPGVTGGARILLRHAVASLLNACHDGVNYPWSVQKIKSKVSQALHSGDRQIMLSLASQLDRINNQYECPLGGKATPKPRR